jgi:hypothetical protein
VASTQPDFLSLAELGDFLVAFTMVLLGKNPVVNISSDLWLVYGL